MGLSDRHAVVSQLRALDNYFLPADTVSKKLLPVLSPLRPLFPEGGLRRGSVVSVVSSTSLTGPVSSLALALSAGLSQEGSWVALVDLPQIGFVAASELGVALEYMVAVSISHQDQWGSTLASLIEAFDVVLVGSIAPKKRDGRRLTARLRERVGTLVTVGVEWPQMPDVTLMVSTIRWHGIGVGHGYLRSRQVRVEVTGRRAASKPHSVDLWLPGVHGSVDDFTSSSVVSFLR